MSVISPIPWILQRGTNPIAVTTVLLHPKVHQALRTRPQLTQHDTMGCQPTPFAPAVNACLCLKPTHLGLVHAAAFSACSACSGSRQAQHAAVLLARSRWRLLYACDATYEESLCSCRAVDNAKGITSYSRGGDLQHAGCV